MFKRLTIMLACLMGVIGPAKMIFAADWAVMEAQWQPDKNGYTQQQVWEGCRWTEGWKLEEQFYPKMFKPAGRVHIVLQNNSGKEQEIALTHVDGVPVQDAVTTPQRVGKVVWTRLDTPQLPVKEAVTSRQDIKIRTVPAGQWVECAIRFREVPQNTVKLRFKVGSDFFEVPVAAKQPKSRFEFIGFSPKMDKVYCYIRSMAGSFPKGKIALDGSAVNANWTNGPKGSGMSLAEISVNPALQFGTYHLVEANLSDGTKLAQPIKAWDGYFSIGLFGSTAKPEYVQAAKEKGINTYYWRDPQNVFAAGLNHVPVYTYGKGRTRTTTQSGTIFNYNWDEPDCGDWSAGGDLPVPDRLGVNAEEIVLPYVEAMRRDDPRTPNMLLIDGTFKPLNYYMYGGLSDVAASDPYQLIGLGQLDYVHYVMDCVRDANTPHPTVAVLWVPGYVYTDNFPSGILQRMGDGDPKMRAPSPREERMMVFYAIGAGAKGIAYFGDFADSPDNVRKDGKWIQLSENKPLFDEVGNINKDVQAIAPLLAVGCPAGTIENDDVWARQIMSGADNIVLVLVNKHHNIAYLTKNTLEEHKPATNVKLSVSLPPTFKKCSVKELKDGALVLEQGNVNAGQLQLSLDTVDSVRVFVISNER